MSNCKKYNRLCYDKNKYKRITAFNEFKNIFHYSLIIRKNLLLKVTFNRLIMIYLDKK